MVASFEEQLLDLIKHFSHAALRQRPANLAQFALAYFTKLAASQDPSGHSAEPVVSRSSQKDVPKSTSLNLTQLKKLYQNISEVVSKACAGEVNEDLFAFLDASSELQSRLVSFMKGLKSLGGPDFANRLMVFACMVEATSFLESSEAIKRLFEVYASPRIQVEKLLVLLSHMVGTYPNMPESFSQSITQCLLNFGFQDKNEVNYEEFTSSLMIKECLLGGIGNFQSK